MLDLAILGLLEDNELHGYEVRKRLREQFGLLANVSFGSIYPALARLEASGAVETVISEASMTGTGSHAGVASGTVGASPGPPPGPSTGSLGGEWAALRARRHSGARGRRSRKVYRITEEGRRTFLELLSGTSPDDARSFGLRLAFAGHMAPQARLGLLERRRANLANRLAEMRPQERGSGFDGYAQAVVEHTVEGMEKDIEWLTRLIEAERATLTPAVRAGHRSAAGASSKGKK